MRGLWLGLGACSVSGGSCGDHFTAFVDERFDVLEGGSACGRTVFDGDHFSIVDVENDYDDPTTISARIEGLGDLGALVCSEVQDCAPEEGDPAWDMGALGLRAAGSKVIRVTMNAAGDSGLAGLDPDLASSVSVALELSVHLNCTGSDSECAALDKLAGVDCHESVTLLAMQVESDSAAPSGGSGGW